jgi:hypothetical protein
MMQVTVASEPHLHPHHAAFVVTSVVLPFIFVLIMNGIEGLVDRSGWRSRLIKISWDSCVLAMGIIGGIFANQDVIKAYSGDAWPVIYAVIGLGISLATAISIAYVRGSIPTSQTAPGWKVILCLALSGASIALPSYVAFTY